MTATGKGRRPGAESQAQLRSEALWAPYVGSTLPEV
jgi:hypothetical protein